MTVSGNMWVSACRPGNGQGVSSPVMRRLVLLFSSCLKRSAKSNDQNLWIDALEFVQVGACGGLVAMGAW